MTSIIKFEEYVLNFWKKDCSFVKSNLNKSKEFIFFEGPPFATGSPHYGHVLGGLMKDTGCRHAVQSGYKVIRRASWDCHGLPVEYEVEKKLNITTKKQASDFGIINYNKACKDIVLQCSNDWIKTITRIGRWIDFESNVKTMDFNYMNIVWNVFATIFNKGLIYQDFKVMPYSNACTTPLSNFEASSNYQTVTDQTVIVKFKVYNEPCYILVWTTTPWTLPANQALCINPSLEYSLVTLLDDNYPLNNNLDYWICTSLIDSVLKTDKYIIKKTVLGLELQEFKYHNLFDSDKIQSIFTDTYVNNSSGTGIVHLAPAFGEDDYRVCKNNGFKPNDIYIPIDDSGYFISGTKPESIINLDIKTSIKIIIKELKNNNSLFSTFNYTHSYPFCWRSDTPLIYKAVSSWFLKVTDIKEQLLEALKITNWVPQNIKDFRFHNWLSDARDWCLSRNRFWGTPIPIWKSDCGKTIVIKSSRELEELAGLPEGSITDLHRDIIDFIVIKKDGIEYKRIEPILDCWFESGSIPFVFSENPNVQADFIAEGIDQTRGWFYTLLVISVCLNGQAPYKNVLVNGIINASDGKKMSKRLKNYPDIMDVVNKYGSDALRIYLITSVASKGECIKFKEEEVKGIMQTIILPITNSFAFYFEYEKKFKLANKEIIFTKSNNPLDHWVINLVNNFVKTIQKYYSAYTYQPIYNLLIEYIDKLNNSYLRLNREHLKTDTTSLAIFKYVLELTILHLAPVLPFLTEHYNLELGNEESIHCKEYLTIDINAVTWLNEDYIKQSSYLLDVLEMIRSLRGNLQRKKPIKKAIIKVLSEMFGMLSDNQMKDFICNETNILDLEITEFKPVTKIYSVKPNFSHLGARSKQLASIIKSLTQEQIYTLVTNKKLIINDNLEIMYNDVFIDITIPSDVPGMVTQSNDELQLSISLDLTQDELTNQVYLAKTVAREFQQLRKELGYHPWDPVKLLYNSEYKLTEYQTEIVSKTTIHKPTYTDLSEELDISKSKKIEILNYKFLLVLN